LQVVVLVTEQEAARLLRPPGDHVSEAGSVLSVTRQLGATIVPQHPGVGDPTLSRYFVVQLPERALAERLVDALLAVPEVESAYVKPGEEPAM
jgi:hypothetical protein